MAGFASLYIEIPAFARFGAPASAGSSQQFSVLDRCGRKNPGSLNSGPDRVISNRLRGKTWF